MKLVIEGPCDERGAAGEPDDSCPHTWNVIVEGGMWLFTPCMLVKEAAPTQAKIIRQMVDAWNVLYGDVANQKDDEKRLLNLVSEEIVKEVDGLSYFWPSRTHGAITSHGLRVIAGEIDRRNKPVEKAIEEYFDKEMQEGKK